MRVIFHRLTPPPGFRPRIGVRGGVRGMLPIAGMTN